MINQRYLTPTQQKQCAFRIISSNQDSTELTNPTHRRPINPTRLKTINLSHLVQSEQIQLNRKAHQIVTDTNATPQIVADILVRVVGLGTIQLVIVKDSVQHGARDATNAE